MKTTLLRTIFGTAYIALLLLMVSCDSGGSSALVGHWLYESGSKRDKPEDMELFKDGTGVCDGASISWKVEDKRLVLFSSLKAIAADYKVSNFELILAYDDGTSATFVKKGYTEQAKEARVATLKANVKKGSFTDSRDGKSYKTIKLNNKTWMAENLNYNAEGSKCYGKDESNCKKYGRLYDWNTAMKACPNGWHLPSKEEWRTLVDLMGGDKVAGKNLKASKGWNQNGNGVDAIGFAALPGGNGGWWSTEKYNNREAFILGIGKDDKDDEVDNWFSVNKDDLSSVRCVED